PLFRSAGGPAGGEGPARVPALRARTAGGARQGGTAGTERLAAADAAADRGLRPAPPDMRKVRRTGRVRRTSSNRERSGRLRTGSVPGESAPATGRHVFLRAVMTRWTRMNTQSS